MSCARPSGGGKRVVILGAVACLLLFSPRRHHQGVVYRYGYRCTLSCSQFDSAPLRWVEGDVAGDVRKPEKLYFSRGLGGAARG